MIPAENRLLLAIINQAVIDYYRGRTTILKYYDPNYKKILTGKTKYYLERVSISRRILNRGFDPVCDEIRTWITTKAGIFELCANALNREPDVAKKMLLEKLDSIDRGEPLKAIDGDYLELNTKKYTKVKTPIALIKKDRCDFTIQYFNFVFAYLQS